MKRPILCAALAVAGSVPAIAAAPAGRDVTVAIAGMQFGPVPAGLKVGDSILWVNRDIVPHSATARDRSFDVIVQPRRSVRVTLRRAGAVAFYCRFHPAMQGRFAVAAR